MLMKVINYLPSFWDLLMDLLCTKQERGKKCFEDGCFDPVPEDIVAVHSTLETDAIICAHTK